jgi:hypothetical protein
MVSDCARDGEWPATPSRNPPQAHRSAWALPEPNEGETHMSSYRKLTVFAATAALAFAIGAAVTPANAILNPNALTQNALTAQGSSLDELNGVAVEAVTLPRQQERPSLLALNGGGDMCCLSMR